MKSIIYVVMDSLRRDVYDETMKPMLDKKNIPHIDHQDFHSCQSTTALSLPYMLSGMKLYSPNINIVKDLEKIGYKTTLLHSNPIVHQFRGSFQETIDLSQRNHIQKLGKKYNRIFRLIENITPTIYNKIKKMVQVSENNYLPYTRIYNALPHITRDNPRFTWMHLMDSHTPYYPVYTQLTYQDIIDINNNQISAVRGYYKPNKDEETLWFNVYKRETCESLSFLVDWLDTIDYSNTTIIFTSDHGEEFGEQGEYGHKGNRFYPENINVPFVVFGKNLPDAIISNHSMLRNYLRRLIN